MDVPTSVTKAAPNFSSVYVIAKGKLSSFRPATHANVNDTGKEDLKSDAPRNRLLAVKSLCFCGNLIPLDVQHLSLVYYYLNTHEVHA